MIDIRDYEAMAKLALSDDERGWISSQAEMLINSFSELDGVDTGDAQPLVTVLEINNVLREDEAVKLISREELLSNAPEQYGGYFQVPRTLE